MIENFEVVKKQLSELSDIINKFKSEAVQLRIIELVLGGATALSEQGADTDTAPAATPKKPGRKTRPRKAKPAAADSDKPKANKPRAKSGAGPIGTLRKLADEGYFNKKHTISEIREYCQTKLAQNFKTNDLSPALGRLTRDKTLEREKNAENQFEYFKK